MKSENINLNNLSLLGKKARLNDAEFNISFELAQAPDESLRDYFKSENCARELWELCCDVPASSKQAFLKYLELPEDTVDFISWIFNYAAEYYFVSDKYLDMNNIPYPELYRVWKYFGDRKERKKRCPCCEF
jgi:hypothetical protein